MALQVFIETENGGGPWAYAGKLEPGDKLLERAIGSAVLTELEEYAMDNHLPPGGIVTIRFKLQDMTPEQVEALPEM